MAFDFLSNLVLVDTGRTRSPKKTNPDGLMIRIYSNGTVYPSQDLVSKFDLEYAPKNEEGQVVGNGLDVIDSKEWEPTKSVPRVILLGVTPRKEKKVDLFALTRYDEEGKPRASVLDQGTVSTQLLDLVRSLGYLNENQKYCDLQVEVDKPITMKDGIAFIPKVMEKGKKKGEKTYERREKVTFYHAVPPDMLREETPQPTTAEEVVTKTITHTE